MKPTLLVLAAGMGSRYGGLKQLDGLGPNGETIMDYSIYDALKAGFGKVVFVIRHSFEEEFREKVVSKYQERIPVEVVFQELDYLPQGFTLNTEREKPWGTNHAVMMAKEVINEPFITINADDFYGSESYQIAADELRTMANTTNNYCMIGYMVGNTLSDSGSVTRGVCEVDAADSLTQIVERSQIKDIDGIPCFLDEADSWQKLTKETPVSMNMFGFTPDYFQHSDSKFIDFLHENKDKLKAEFLIPTLVNTLVKEKKVKVKVLSTPSDWFGVTYPTDRPDVVSKIKELVDNGKYPQKLF